MGNRIRSYFGWPSVAMTLSAVACFVCPAGSSAQILIDDFTEVSDPGSYPATQVFSTPAVFITDGVLTSTISDLRSVFLAAGPELPPPDPFPSDVSVTVDIDTTLGQLTTDASADSTTLLNMFWVNELASPMNVDLTGMSELVIDYSSTADFDLTVTLNNLQPGTTNTTAANEETFVLPSAVNGQLRIPLADISDPVQVQLQPPGTFYPNLDKSSVDLVLLEFGTFTLDTTLVLDKLEFVPEPGSAALLLTGLLTLTACGRRRRSGHSSI